MENKKEEVKEEKKDQQIQPDPTEKGTYWWFILYPDSALENWKEILELTGLRISISPLHDKDLKVTNEDRERDPNNKFGVFKKPHYHVLLFWQKGSPTTYRNASQVMKSVNGVRLQKVLDPYGAYWYLIHRFNREKTLYDNKDRINLNGLSEDQILELDQDLQFQIKQWFVTIIYKCHLKRFKQLYQAIENTFIDAVTGEQKKLPDDFIFNYDMLLKFAYNNSLFLKTHLDDVYKEDQEKKEIEKAKKEREKELKEKKDKK